MVSCNEWIICETTRKYRNDSLINEHKSMYIKTTIIYTIIQVLPPFNLHTIKGEWTAGLLSNNLSRFADVRSPPTTPGGDQRTKTVQSTTQRLQRLLSFRTSPQEGLHNRTTSPTLSCSCFVADSHDHLQFLQTWLSAAGTITLFDAPLHESSAANSTIFASVGRR